jgi:hypothetical protein
MSVDRLQLEDGTGNLLLDGASGALLLESSTPVAVVTEAPRLWTPPARALTAAAAARGLTWTPPARSLTWPSRSS